MDNGNPKGQGSLFTGKFAYTALNTAHDVLHVLHKFDE